VPRLAIIGRAGYKGANAIFICEGVFLLIEPQFCFAVFLIRTVAKETFVRKDRANVAREVDFLCRTGEEEREACSESEDEIGFTHIALTYQEMGMAYGTRLQVKNERKMNPG
jgi:hypothetical protein